MAEDTTKQSDSSVVMRNGEPVPAQQRGLTPWPKGVSGNPKGRPKKRVLTTAMENLITEGMEGHDDLPKALAQKAVDLALGGNFQFFNLILERLDGKVAEQLQAEVTHILVTYERPELPVE